MGADTRKGRSKGALFVRLPHPLYERVVVLAEREHRTLTGQITLMLEQWLAGNTLEQEATVLAQELRQARCKLAGEEKVYFPPDGLGAEPK